MRSLLPEPQPTNPIMVEMDNGWGSKGTLQTQGLAWITIGLEVTSVVVIRVTVLLTSDTIIVIEAGEGTGTRTRVTRTENPDTRVPGVAIGTNEAGVLMVIIAGTEIKGTGPGVEISKDM